MGSPWLAKSCIQRISGPVSARRASFAPITSGSLVGSLRALEPGRSWSDSHGINIRPHGAFTRDNYLKPGKIYKLNVMLAPRVTQVQPGYSLRLTITTRAPTSSCRAGLGSNPCYPTVSQQATLPGMANNPASAQLARYKKSKYCTKKNQLDSVLRGMQ